MTKLTGFALIIFIIAVSVYGVFQWRQDIVPSNEDENVELLPDYVAESLSTNIYSADGKLSHIINAEKMEHYNATNTTHFTEPNYTLYPKNTSSPWKVSAKHGTLNHKNRVRLENRVELVATDKDSLVQQIHGKYLELDLNTNVLSSDHTIVIEGKDFIMYGSGLIVDLNTTQMTLTEHVQTIYRKITP
ncbi:LPS export ABC transporter periplasmic protein LptC [Thalassotalea sp. LPB0316]|uniref:LPS export ABC transporter periplasmic protein LptC n=1 Tax=Thalassotalea sp. LPB0316 TaxID=2769490 RepID=UPI0018668B1D|nr:LPS export ABC transporter periplasmic protein LptC [Thalassotalea sp. LPB0316]QOL26900.1 LPS export ABC transporter periplasmic protein LptC [Thalassotalea sp. LPB0316]